MLSEKDRKNLNIFIPFALNARDRIESDGLRFVHYTSAESAIKILTTSETWIRNAITMNDFSEIIYGKNCIMSAYSDEKIGGRLRDFLKSFGPGFLEKWHGLFNGWLPHFENQTYLTSLSEHHFEEDHFGRLSTWRAYAQQNGVALVLKNAPFTYISANLGAYSYPVVYSSVEDFKASFSEAVSRIFDSDNYIRNEISENNLLMYLFMMFRFMLFCIKHPGFKE